MSKKGIKVSVIIPTYNYGRFITTAIDSVLVQDYPQELVEIIVLDDGSTDDTRERLQTYISKKQLQYHYQQNAGKAVATQNGIELAKGDIIFNLDADDWFLPDKLKHTVSLFKTDPGLVHVASPARICWEDGSRPDETEPVPAYLLGDRLQGTNTLRYFMKNNMLYGGGSTFAARKWALQKMSWKPEIDMFTDEWLVISLLLQGSSYLLPTPLSVWRVHSTNFSGASSEAKLIQKQQRLERSSAAILSLLETGDYPGWLVKAYRLKHQVRKMVWLEERNEKTPADILKFINRGILSGNSLKVLKSYHAFNRLAPGWVKRRLKA